MSSHSRHVHVPCPRVCEECDLWRSLWRGHALPKRARALDIHHWVDDHLALCVSHSGIFNFQCFHHCRLDGTLVDQGRYRNLDSRVVAAHSAAHSMLLLSSIVAKIQSSRMLHLPVRSTFVEEMFTCACCLPLRCSPNSHCSSLIAKHAATHADAQRVVIFSESKSFEPLNVFSNKGYELILDGDVLFVSPVHP
jgi:hypothetical protein